MSCGFRGPVMNRTKLYWSRQLSAVSGHDQRRQSESRVDCGLFISDTGRAHNSHKKIGTKKQKKKKKQYTRWRAIKVCTETFCICFSLTVREVRRENDISKRCMYRKKQVCWCSNKDTRCDFYSWHYCKSNSTLPTFRVATHIAQYTLYMLIGRSVGFAFTAPCNCSARNPAFKKLILLMSLLKMCAFINVFIAEVRVAHPAQAFILRDIVNILLCLCMSIGETSVLLNMTKLTLIRQLSDRMNFVIKADYGRAGCIRLWRRTR